VPEELGELAGILYDRAPAAPEDDADTPATPDTPDTPDLRAVPAEGSEK
jgi:cytochrome c biogenesis protein